MSQLGQYWWSHRQLLSLRCHCSEVVVTLLVVGFGFVGDEEEAHAVSHMVHMIERIE